MKGTKKLIALLTASALALSLAACSGGGSAETPAPEGTTPAGSTAPEGETYLVGICQLAPHNALDAATQGFKDALTAEFGDAVKFSEGNAGGDSNNCITIIDGFLAEDVDLILANATASLTTAASATDSVPILGTAITNYGVALNLDSTKDGVLGGNISGTSDLAPLDQQAEMLQELFPAADYPSVGLLYCSAEPNSIFQVDTIQGYLEEMGYTCEQYAFTDVNDLASVTQTACDNSDVIYIPTDNTAANNTETIANVVIPAGVPVVAGESGICSGCGVATLSIDYYELGEITGQMAARILRGEESVSEMAIEYDTTLTKLYNAANCEALGITIPEDYEPIA
ncbi:ABC transporter substrate-binding protein [uncultured Intestinimonas sp.]|uniref:ABC transporter substrate-binding protein n=1 Tax=uncultured Intestinimonas sp. TaxID=1689265 RepID=UPI0025CCD09D|nr:ABC transporter substrate-binding protein [uncultured Intestinimonas sp.]